MLIRLNYGNKDGIMTKTGSYINSVIVCIIHILEKNTCKLDYSDLIKSKRPGVLAGAFSRDIKQ
jgi:hypothetical protein